jgi:hypothetical protein
MTKKFTPPQQHSLVKRKARYYAGGCFAVTPVEWFCTRCCKPIDSKDTHKRCKAKP